MKTEPTVILDLDGTLVDTKADLCGSVNYVRSQFGLAPMDEVSIGNLIGRGAHRLIHGALEHRSAAEIARGLEIFLDYYREHMLDRSRLYPGVKQTLEALSGSKLAILTNKPYKFSRLMLERLDILRHFRAVYGGNSFRWKKPDPIGIFRILSDTQGHPDETWMVGDSSVDVQTGKNAGVRTCGVTYGYEAHGFKGDPPDVVIDRFSQLPDIVGLGSVAGA